VSIDDDDEEDDGDDGAGRVGVERGEERGEYRRGGVVVDDVVVVVVDGDNDDEGTSPNNADSLADAVLTSIRDAGSCLHSDSSSDCREALAVNGTHCSGGRVRSMHTSFCI
jgi:hypothetical protein